jgi:homoserine kinase
MSLPTAVTVKVPATTANLGPGFDCIGAALTLYNQFKFTISSTGTDKLCQITVTGLEAERVKTDESNLAYQAFAKFYQQLGKKLPFVQIDIQLGIPLARGLGSSATAIVAGMVAANSLLGSLLDRQTIIQFAAAVEGHPDNVVPALLGGCCLAASSLHADHDWVICDIPWHPHLVPVVAIPDFELSTQTARQVLPDRYSRADAVFNTAHLGLLLRGLETGQENWLRSALQDRIHQPYRQALIPGYEVVQAAAITAGAYGLVISGAGPTLLALARFDQAQAVQSAMTNAWACRDIPALVMVLQMDTQGAIVERSAPQ